MCCRVPQIELESRLAIETVLLWLICDPGASMEGCFPGYREKTVPLLVLYLGSPSHGLVELSPFRVPESTSEYLEVILALLEHGRLES